MIYSTLRQMYDFYSDGMSATDIANSYINDLANKSTRDVLEDTISMVQIVANMGNSFLSDVHGFGNVPNLQIAMSKDSKLKAMVEEYIAADETKRESLLDVLIYRWTGSEDVDPYSRDPKKIYPHVMDARQLVTLEHLTGHGYLGTWCWGSTMGDHLSTSKLCRNGVKFNDNLLQPQE